MTQKQRASEQVKPVKHWLHRKSEFKLIFLGKSAKMIGNFADGQYSRYKNAIRFKYSKHNTPSLFGEKIIYPKFFLVLHLKLYCSYAPAQKQSFFQVLTTVAWNIKQDRSSEDVVQQSAKQTQLDTINCFHARKRASSRIAVLGTYL